MSVLYSSSVARRALLEVRARHYRHEATPSERLLWSAMRGKGLGVAFRRQVVIEAFIVDFLAEQIRLVVEIDGDAYHATRAKADAARERKLVRAGYTVLRIPASVLELDLAQTVSRVREAIEALT